MRRSQKHYLAIETSSPRLSLAIGDGQRVVGRYEGALEWRHAEGLFKGLHALLGKARWSPQSLTGVAVSVGPGSFTGIRIGLAAARALGQTLRIPVVGRSALESLAHGSETHERWICPVIDALRGDVFGALYELDAHGERHRRLAETRMNATAWHRKVRRLAGRATVLWIGDAVPLYRASPHWTRLDHSAAERQWFPKAATLLEIAQPALVKAGPRSYEKVTPLYLREAAAIERRQGKYVRAPA